MRDGIEGRARRVVEEFSALEDWVERYRYLVSLGDRSPPLPEEDRTEDTRLPGCQYGLWIRTDYDRDRGVMRFRAHSDARIVRGLAALVIRVLDDLPPAAIADAELGFLDDIGLRAHLSAQRNTGLSAMIHEMKTRAREHRPESAEPRAPGEAP